MVSVLQSCEDIVISMSTDFKIIANINSHQFLPNIQACNYKPRYFPDTAQL